MSSELSSQTELASESDAHQVDSRRPEDEAIEAIVYELHPALAQRRAAMAYPYGPQVRTAGNGSVAGGENAFHVRQQDIYRPPVQPLFRFDFTESKPDYVVPPRFGLSGILGMTTALAILFGCMRFLDAEPGWYLFYGFQSVVICIVQMFHGQSPRRASAVAGAILGPLFVLGNAIAAGGNHELLLFLVVLMVPCGAFLGYLNGTCAAGIFLVMDKVERYLKGSSASDSPMLPPAVPAS